MQNSPIEVKKKRLDGLFTTISVVFFLAGFYLIESSALAGKEWYIRLAVVIVSLLISLVSLMMTGYRAKILSLFYGARIELRKVHWASKDESIKTTLMVLVIVSVFALFLSLIDWILALIVRGIM